MQHTTTIGNRTLLFVKMPEGAECIRLHHYELAQSFAIWYNSPNKNFTHIEPVPSGTWQLLGKVGEITEEQAATIADIDGQEEGLCIWYRNYNRTGLAFLVKSFPSASKSFHSLLNKERIYLVNPYGEKPQKTDVYMKDGGGERYSMDLEEWRDAEERTGTWAVLIKIKK